MASPPEAEELQDTIDDLDAFFDLTKSTKEQKPRLEFKNLEKQSKIRNWLKSTYNRVSELITTRSIIFFVVSF